METDLRPASGAATPIDQSPGVALSLSPTIPIPSPKGETSGVLDMQNGRRRPEPRPRQTGSPDPMMLLVAAGLVLFWIGVVVLVLVFA